MAFSRAYLDRIKRFCHEHRLGYMSTGHAYVKQRSVCLYMLSLARTSEEQRARRAIRIGGTTVLLWAPQGYTLWFIHPEHAPHADALPELLAAIQMRGGDRIVITQVHGKVMRRLPAIRRHVQVGNPYGTDVWNCCAAFLCATENMHDPFAK